MTDVTIEAVQNSAAKNVGNGNNISLLTNSRLLLGMSNNPAVQHYLENIDNMSIIYYSK